MGRAAQKTVALRLHKTDLWLQQRVPWMYTSARSVNHVGGGTAF